MINAIAKKYRNLTIGKKLMNYIKVDLSFKYIVSDFRVITSYFIIK